jgi:hypothetical protein
VVFFFHGHEVMHLNKQYPQPYPYMKKSGLIKRSLQKVYDEYKINKWRKYFISTDKVFDFIFVSAWLRDVFYTNFNIRRRAI